MEVLMAGLVGACAAAAIMIFYNSVSQKMARRTDLTMDVISWADDVYDRLITIHAQRDATFTGVPFGLSNDEYRTIVKEVKAMLLASKMRAKVALVYGSGAHLRKFDSLREEFIAVTEMLLQAESQTWEELNKQINDKFTNVIEPLMKSVETMFISGARSLSVTRDLMKASAPTLYLPVQKKDLVLKPSGGSSMKGVGTFIAWQSVRLAETFFAVVRILIVLAVIGSVAWFYVGKPDIAALLKTLVMTSTKEVMPGSRIELCVASPKDYALAESGETAPLKDDTVLTVDKFETAIRLAVTNGEDVDIANGVLMLFLGEDVMTANDRAWRASWQEIGGRKGRWFAMSFKDDLPPGATRKLEPPIEVRFPADGDYKIAYKYFSDNFPPKTGAINFRINRR